MGFVFPEDRHQDVSAVDDLLLGRKRVDRGALQHPFNADRLLRVRFHSGGQPFDRLLQELLEALLEAPDVRAAGRQDLPRLSILEQCEEQVLEREVLVVHPLGVRERQSKARLQFLGYQGAGHLRFPPVPSKALTEIRSPAQVAQRS